MLRARAEPHQSDIGVLPRRDGPDLFHVDLACDHVVSEPDHDVCEQLEPVSFLVRDQNTELATFGAEPHDRDAPITKKRSAALRTTPSPSKCAGTTTRSP